MVEGTPLSGLTHAFEAPLPSELRMYATALGVSGYVTPGVMHTDGAPQIFPVASYGAIGDGATDDTVAIQAAIAAAQAVSGGLVTFEAKAYKITATLRVGNGTASSVSSFASVRLEGIGPAWMPPQFFAGYPVTFGTRLLWRGASGGTMVSIRGPLQGWGVNNMALDGAPDGGDFGGLAGIGLEVISAQNGDCSNLTIRGCRNSGIYSTTVNPFGGVGNTDSLNNHYRNVNIGVAWVNGAKGIVLTGGGGASNTDYNIFTSPTITMPTVLGGGQTAYGIYLQACDSIIIVNPHFFNGSAAFSAVTFDYQVNASWPAGCQIINPDWGGIPSPILTGGTPDANARPNIVSGINECNGGVFPENVPNMTFHTGAIRTLRRDGQTVGTGAQILCPIRIRGLYRINYYLICTGGVSGGGFMDLSVSWLDGIGTPVFTSAAVLNGPGNKTSGSIVALCAIPSDIGYAVNFHSVSGSTLYSLFLVAERLM